MQIANEIKDLITDHNKVIPTILEIPGKEVPYDPQKVLFNQDALLMKAARQLYGSEGASTKIN